MASYVAKFAAKQTFGKVKKGIFGEEEEEQEQPEPYVEEPAKPITPARDKRRFLLPYFVSSVAVFSKQTQAIMDKYRNKDRNPHESMYAPSHTKDDDASRCCCVCANPLPYFLFFSF